MNNKSFKIILLDISLLCIPMKCLTQKTSIEGQLNPIHELLPITRPFIISGSIEKIIEFLQGFPHKTSYVVLKHIVQEKESSLNQYDKAHLIFGLANAFKEDKNITEKIFDLLFIINGKTISQWLVDAAKKEYTKIIPLFLTWAQSRKIEHPELVDIKKKSLLRAIDSSNIKAFNNLINSDLAPDKNFATQLLWYVVSNNKDSAFIGLLAKHRADLWSTKNGHTLATKAVELNNGQTLNALITSLKKHGATQSKISNYLNRFVDKEIGTPIQIALETGFTKIELYLRKQGSRE